MKPIPLLPRILSLWLTLALALPPPACSAPFVSDKTLRPELNKTGLEEALGKPAAGLEEPSLAEKIRGLVHIMAEVSRQSPREGTSPEAFEPYREAMERLGIHYDAFQAIITLGIEEDITQRVLPVFPQFSVPEEREKVRRAFVTVNMALFSSVVEVLLDASRRGRSLSVENLTREAHGIVRSHAQGTYYEASVQPRQTRVDQILDKMVSRTRDLFRIESAGLEEDVTAEFLGTHPFTVEAFSGPADARQKLFVTDAQGHPLIPQLGSMGTEAKNRLAQWGVTSREMTAALEPNMDITERELTALLISSSKESVELSLAAWVRQAIDLPSEVILGALQKLASIPDETIIQTLLTQEPLLRQQRLQAVERLILEDVPDTDRWVFLLQASFVARLKKAIDASLLLDATQVFQVAMVYLLHDDYAVLKDHINRFLTNPTRNPRLSELVDPIETMEEIERLELWQMKEGDVTMVLRVEVSLKNRPEKIRFVLNVAKDPGASTENVIQTHGLLERFYEIDPDFVMEPYQLYLMQILFQGPAGDSRRPVAILAGEWIEGDEIHFYADTDPPWLAHEWRSQREQRAALSEDDSDQVWEAAVYLSTLYSQIQRTGSRQEDMTILPAVVNMNAGDLVRYRKPNGTMRVLLVWPRFYSTHSAASVFSSKLLIAAPDVLHSAYAPIWWDKPEKALPMVVAALSKRFREEARILGLSEPSSESWVNNNLLWLARQAHEFAFPSLLNEPEANMPRWSEMSASQKNEALEVVRRAQQTLEIYLRSPSTVPGTEGTGTPQAPPAAGLEEPPGTTRRGFLGAVAVLAASAVPITRFAGLFENGDPDRMVQDKFLGARLNVEQGRGETYVVDLNAVAPVDPAQLPAMERILAHPGAGIPSAWRNVKLVLAPKDLEAAEAFLAENARRGDVFLVAPDAAGPVKDWGNLFIRYGVLGIHATAGVVKTINQLTNTELVVLLASLGPQGGLILGAEIQSRTPGERNLLVSA